MDKYLTAAKRGQRTWSCERFRSAPIGGYVFLAGTQPAYEMGAASSLADIPVSRMIGCEIAATPEHVAGKQFALELYPGARYHSGPVREVLTERDDRWISVFSADYCGTNREMIRDVGLAAGRVLIGGMIALTICHREPYLCRLGPPGLRDRERRVEAVRAACGLRALEQGSQLADGGSYGYHRPGGVEMEVLLFCVTAYVEKTPISRTIELMEPTPRWDLAPLVSWMEDELDGKQLIASQPAALQARGWDRIHATVRAFTSEDVRARYVDRMVALLTRRGGLTRAEIKSGIGGMDNNVASRAFEILRDHAFELKGRWYLKGNRYKSSIVGGR